MSVSVDQLIEKESILYSESSSLPLQGFHYFMENSYVYMMSKKGIKIKKGIIMEISFATRE